MINKLIGNTPMIKINYIYDGIMQSIYTKLEYYNLTGSIKDRVAYYIIKNAYDSGLLKEKTPIIEATSGNTGISLAAIGNYFNNPVYIFMPDWVSSERKSIMEMYGSTVKLFSKDEGGFNRCMLEAKKLCEEINGFLADQFNNSINTLAHFETTGPEILNSIKCDAFISGIGTGGTLMGIGSYLKRQNPNTKIYALEPDSMSLIKTTKIGSHKIDGIGDEFIPDIVDLNMIDDVFLINDEDAINMARKLSKELGLGVGISSGANMLGAVLLNNIIEGNTATVFPDDSKKYISTELSDDIDYSKSFISNKIELIDYEIL